MTDHEDGWHLERAAERAVRRRYRSVWHRTKTALVVGTVYITAAGVVSIDPFHWFQAPDCGTQKSATVHAEPAAVKIATDQGRLLRRLAGPPPTPEQTNRVATEAADAVVVTVLAFLASAKDKPVPAKVTAYNTAHAKQAAAKEAQAVAACVPPCPTDTPPGPVTVAHTPGLAGEPLARAAAQAAGFTGAHLEEAVAVARAESGFNPRAANPTSSARGMWQIMLSAHQDQADINQWADPYASARMAYAISNGGTDWTPWSVWPTVRGKVQPVAGGMECASFPTTGYKTGAGAAWGGYRNGRIPASALAHPRTAPAHSLRPDAAAAFDRLSDAYKARFGRPLGVTDSYRSYAGQLSCRASKGNMCADPGTSNHGWGLALDLQLRGFDSPEYAWFQQNASRYGWVSPPWSKRNGSKPEFWHAEWSPVGSTT